VKENKIKITFGTSAFSALLNFKQNKTAENNFTLSFQIEQ